jgi:hypothetical protein
MRAFKRTQVRSNADNSRAGCRLRANVGCCVRPCCVGAAACDRDAARVHGCSVRATVVRAACWSDREYVRTHQVRSNALWQYLPFMSTFLPLLAMI